MTRKVLLVTAASRGIGAAVCRLAAANDYDVAVNYLSSPDAAEKVAADCRAAGARAIAVRADVTREEDVEAMFAAVDQALGPVHGLVNNAGGAKIILGDDGRTIADASADDIRRILDLNVTSTILCAREAIRRMSTAHGGTGGAIVNISSDCSRRGGAVARKDGAKGSGLDNYVRVLTSPTIVSAIVATSVFTVGALVLTMTVRMALALHLERDNRWNVAMRAVALVPYVIAMLVGSLLQEARHDFPRRSSSSSSAPPSS